MAKFLVTSKKVLYATAIVDAENEGEAFEMVDNDHEEYFPNEVYVFDSEGIEDVTKIAE